MARNANHVLVRRQSFSNNSHPANKARTISRASDNELFHEYYLLYRIAATLTDKMEAERPIREVKKIVSEFFHPQEYALLLWEEKSQGLRLKSRFGFARPRAELLALEENRHWQTALRRKHPVHVPDLALTASPLLAHWKTPVRRGDFVAAPLYVNAQRSLGIMSLYREKPNSFTAVEIKLLQKIAVQLGKVLDKIALYHQTRALSITDALTGLYNRRYFNERYGIEFMRAARYGRPLAVLVIDIDHFKKFNDEHGHLVGDKVLKMTAKILEENIRKADILARFGGEEFIVVLPEIDKEHGCQVAEKLRRAIELTHFPKEESQPLGHLTASFGLAAFPEDAAEGNKLLALADHALYAAKANGRNRVEVAKPIVQAV